MYKKTSKQRGTSDLQGGFDWTEAPKSRSKPKSYNQSPIITSYLAERNRVLGIEHMYGVKSAKPAIIEHEMEAKLKRMDRHAEDNIVNAWAKYFKKTHPGIPYTIDKIAQKRSGLSGAILSAANYMKGNPDIFIQCQRGGFAGCFIEQKRSEDELFYAGTRIIKPGANLRHIWQSLYHAELREQGYYVVWSISLEASIKISNAYMSGKPFNFPVYPYYCAPKDRAQFEFHKHFNPVEKKP